MPPILKKTLGSRWFITSLHAALWLLLYPAVANLGGKAPDFRDADAVATPPQNPVPVAALQRLYSSDPQPRSLIGTNTVDPFLTRYFVPPAPPPPPTTRKIEVTYQGFYQTGGGPKQIIFRLGEAYLVAPVGARIATNLFIAEVTMQAMTLTNLAAQTNILPLNAKKELVVPIQ
jgi:hypothetical protein